MKTKYMKVEDGKKYNIGKYPSFPKSGTILGMKNLWYGKDALLIKCGSWIYYVGNECRCDHNDMNEGETLYYNVAY